MVDHNLQGDQEYTVLWFDPGTLLKENNARIKHAKSFHHFLTLFIDSYV